MDNTISLDLSRDQAAQLSALIEECLQEMRATNEAMAQRQAEIEQLQAETRAIIARMQERVNVETDY